MHPDLRVTWSRRARNSDANDRAGALVWQRDHGGERRARRPACHYCLQRGLRALAARAAHLADALVQGGWQFHSRGFMQVCVDH